MPRYGVNAGHRELRLGSNPERAAAWSAAVRGLGVETVRAGIFRADDELSWWWPGAAPVDPELNDLRHLIRTMTANPDLRFSVVVQDSSGFQPIPKFVDATGTDLRRRRAYFTEFGYSIGRGIADAGLAEQVVFFELGNEPDLAAILCGAPHSGMAATDYDEAAVARVRATVSAMKRGLTAAFEDAGIPRPPVAFGVSAVHWGMTDLIWKGTTPSSPETPTAEPMDWDVTVVHWYYDNSYGTEFGNLLEQDTGFERVPMTWVPRPNPAHEFSSRYGRPIAITEFGIRNNAPEYSGDPAKRATALVRLAAGLTGSATRYDISDMMLFSLTDEPPASEAGDALPGWEGAYGVATWDEATATFLPRSTYDAYRDFVAQPIPAGPFALVFPTEKLAIPQPAPGEDGTRVLTFEGRGTPGAVISIAGTASGRIVATGTVDESGAWAATTKPNDGVVFPGEFTVAISQRLGTAVAPDAEHLNWLVTARRLTVTVPADGSTVPRPVDGQPFSGNGEPGAMISVRGTTGREVVAGPVPPASPAWELRTLPGDDVVYPGIYTVLVTQQVGDFVSAPVRVTWTVGS